MSTFPITSPVANLPYEMRQTFAGEFVFIKNSYVAGLLDAAAFNPITDTDYPGWHSYTVVSITRSGSVATVETSAPTPLETGDTVTIAGADQTEYNGTFVITVTDSTHFTYTVTGTPVTPATGSITLQGGTTTVPGIVIVDDYALVCDVRGNLWNSDRGSYADWDALSFIPADLDSSLPVVIARTLNYCGVFKEWDTQFFYDAQIAPPGSPFLSQDSAYTKLGCAAAKSLVEFDGGLILITQRDQLQRSREVHVFNGLTPQKISTAQVERLLNADTLETVYSLYLSTAGHQFYVLTLVGSEITIAYDFANGRWAQWTTLTAQSTKPVIALSRSGKTVTAVVTDHGYADGDPVTIAGADQDGYNGTWNIRFIDENTFTHQVDSAPTTPATGTITAMGYDESYLNATNYATFQNLDVVLAETGGLIYALDRSIYMDTDVPIDVRLRTGNWDGGSQNQVIVTYARPIGDEVDGKILVRWTDDDYQTYSKYMQTDMSFSRPQVTNLGSTRRRAFEVRYTEDTELRLESLEVQATKGYT